MPTRWAEPSGMVGFSRSEILNTLPQKRLTVQLKDNCESILGPKAPD